MLWSRADGGPTQTRGSHRHTRHSEVATPAQSFSPSMRHVDVQAQRGFHRQWNRADGGPTHPRSIQQSDVTTQRGLHMLWSRADGGSTHTCGSRRHIRHSGVADPAQSFSPDIRHSDVKAQRGLHAQWSSADGGPARARRMRHKAVGARSVWCLRALHARGRAQQQFVLPNGLDTISEDDRTRAGSCEPGMLAEQASIHLPAVQA